MGATITPLGSVNPLAGGSTPGAGVNPGLIPSVIPTANPIAHPAATSPIASPTSAIPTVAPTIANVGNEGQLNDIYGATGGVVTSLEEQANPANAAYLGQTIINANQPNVDKGLANLNTSLAASGISPSSSVSAIENADYMAGVENSNLETLSKTNLDEQNIELGLLSDILPSAQQQQTDSSAWSIFGDVMQGIGDVAGAIPYRG